MAVFIMICFGIICLTGCTTIAKHQNVSDSAVFTTEETTTEEEATTVKPGDEISTEPIVYVPQEGIYVSENPDSPILIYVDYFGAQIWDISKLDGGHEPEYYLGRTDYPYYVKEWDDNYAEILGITVLSDSLLMYEGERYTHQRTEVYESGYVINYTGYPQYDELIDKLLAIRLQSVTSHMDFSDKGYSTSWFYMSTFVHGGYYLIDLDNNGIPELLLGENGQQAWAGTIYEVYTIKDGKAVKLLNGGERGNSMLCMNNIICYEGSGSAFHNEWAFYKLSNGELVLETGIIFNDEPNYGDPDNPWNLCYGELSMEDSVKITEEEARAIIAGYTTIPIEFTLFCEPKLN